jgi:hypothetical protein
MSANQFVDEILAVCDEYAIAVPPSLLAQLERLYVPPAGVFSGLTLPDANGNVQATDVPAWAGHPVQIPEVTNSQAAGDAKDRALANLSHANGEYNIAMQFVGACYECKTVDGKQVLDMDKPIMGSVSYPQAFNATVADFLAFAATHNPPGPNPDAPPFPHP